jgi:hypothetical protein
VTVLGDHHLYHAERLENAFDGLDNLFANGLLPG